MTTASPSSWVGFSIAGNQPTGCPIHDDNPSVVIPEVERAGFRFLHQYDFAHADDNDYFLVFERR